MAGGTATKIKSLTAGEYFGERSLLKNEVAVASVVAAEATELLCLTKKDFEALLGPMSVLKTSIERQSSQRDEELSQKTLSIGKVCVSYILHLTSVYLYVRCKM